VPTGESLSALALLERLVAFPSISSDSNLDLIQFVGAYLEGWGVPWRLSRSVDGHKANLFATLPATSGETRRGGLVLSGHTDVVPVAAQPWTSDPFTLTERAGKLYGRGTSDMKGFCAVALAQVPALVANPLPIPLHFALSCDEETGCQGVPSLLADLLTEGISPRAALIGEPTLMQVVNSHKGCYVLEALITGVPAHSSQPHRGASAISAAAKLIAVIEREDQAALTRQVPSSDFEPPRSSLTVAMIDGGTATNIIPGRCRLAWDLRLAPWDSADAILGRIYAAVATDIRPALKAQHPDADIEIRPIATVPPLRPDQTSALERLALTLTGNNRAIAVSYATEAGLFQQEGMDTIICGPGSIDQAHQPNEFIDPAQLEACADFLGRLFDKLRAGELSR
jgi:acetylornithine deacetylase